MIESLHLEVTGASHIGMKRTMNEDAYYFNKEESLFIVADGMGGHLGGEVASHMCIDIIVEYLHLNYYHSPPTSLSQEEKDKYIQDILQNSVYIASKKIEERGKKESTLKGMATTLSAMMILQNRVYVVHIGDSRLYAYKNKNLIQFTNDHSLVGEQLRSGLITKEELKTHAYRHIITRGVGLCKSKEEIDNITFILDKKDYLLLSTDGLHDQLEESEIIECIERFPSDALSHMIRLANEHGGEDNITGILVHAS